MENNIRDLRRRYHVSQAELGSAVGVSRQTITSVERGQSVPQLALAYKISRYFDQTIEQVFDLSGLDGELPAARTVRVRRRLLD